MSAFNVAPGVKARGAKEGLFFIFGVWVRGQTSWIGAAVGKWIERLLNRSRNQITVFGVAVEIGVDS
jgi:hypothetical protein